MVMAEGFPNANPPMAAVPGSRPKQSVTSLPSASKKNPRRMPDTKKTI